MTDTRSHRSRRWLAAVGAPAAVAWLALALGLEPVSEMASLWRYRALEDGEVEAAEMVDAAGLALAGLARRVAVPGASRTEAAALARLAETEHAEGDLSEARSLYARSVRAFEAAGHGDDPVLADVLTRHSRLLHETGEPARARRALERARAIRSGGAAPP